MKNSAGTFAEKVFAPAFYHGRKKLGLMENSLGFLNIMPAVI